MLLSINFKSKCFLIHTQRKYRWFCFYLWVYSSIVFVVVRVIGMAGLMYYGIKTVFLVGRVLDGPQGTIRIVYTVRSLYHVTIPGFVRGLVVTSVWILYTVLVRILRMGLMEHVIKQC